MNADKHDDRSSSSITELSLDVLAAITGGEAPLSCQQLERRMDAAEQHLYEEERKANGWSSWMPYSARSWAQYAYDTEWNNFDRRHCHRGAL
jgi:hypothetical protein